MIPITLNGVNLGGLITLGKGGGGGGVSGNKPRKCQWGLYERGRDAVLKHRNREGPGARTPSRKREKQSYGCERDDSPETEQRKSFKLCQTHFRFMAGISYTSYNGNIQRGKGSFIVCISRWKH